MRNKLLLLLLFTMIFLTSCSNKQVQHISFDGKNFELDSEYENNNKLKYSIKLGGISSGESYDMFIEEISDGFKITYNYETYVVVGTKDSYTVTYPNDSKNTVKTTGNTKTYFGSGENENYPDIYEFEIFLNDFTNNGNADSGQLLFGLLLLIFGAISVVNPRISWFLRKGWMFKDSEPSDLYLTITKFSGFVSCFVGVILILTSFH